MKILHIVPYFKWSYGGTVTSVYGLSQILADKDHEITVYTTNITKCEKEKEIEFKNGKINVKYFKCLSNFLANKFHINISEDMRLELKKNLKNYDIIHLHEFRGLTGIYVWYYASKNKVPYVLQAHGAVPRLIFGEGKLKFLMKSLFDKIIGKKILNSARAVIALTETEKRYYNEIGFDKDSLKIIPNGINFLEYENLPEIGKFKKNYSIHEDEKIILYLGRIQDIKGIDLLVSSFAKLSKQLNNTKLVIVGPDEGFLFQLKELVKSLGIIEKVIFTGPIYGEEKLNVYCDSTIYVLPSIYETFPNTVLEAAACGIPIIVTEKCGISDIVRDKMGLVVKLNEKELTDAMILLINDKELRERFSKNGRFLTKNNFSWENVAEMFEDIYLVR